MKNSSSHPREKIIMGMDPGTQIMGYGVIKVSGKEVLILDLGVLRLKSIKGHFLKLSHIYRQTLKLIEEHLPDELAVEAPFYGKNPQSMLKLGRAQGVAISAAISRQIPVTEYAPKKMKAAVTGDGNASKEKVAGMLGHLCQNMPKEMPLLDATDALGVALCHHFNLQNEQMGGKKHKGWGDFLKNNPSRQA